MVTVTERLHAIDALLMALQSQLKTLYTFEIRLPKWAYTSSISCWRHGPTGKPWFWGTGPYPTHNAHASAHQRLAEAKVRASISATLHALRPEMEKLCSTLARAPSCKRIQSWPQIWFSVGPHSAKTSLAMFHVRPFKEQQFEDQWDWSSGALAKACSIILDSSTVGTGPQWFLRIGHNEHTVRAETSQEALAWLAATSVPSLLSYNRPKISLLSQYEKATDDLLALREGLNWTLPSPPDF